jgi:hypothetical protein
LLSLNAKLHGVRLSSLLKTMLDGLQVDVAHGSAADQQKMCDSKDQSGIKEHLKAGRKRKTSFEIERWSIVCS